MKKRVLLFTAILAIGYCTFSSFDDGPANSGYDCTGAETGHGNQAGCSSPGSSCHSPSATTGILLAIELDSAGVPVTHYKGGMSYTIKITGTNTTTDSLPRFGFQIGVITGSVAATTPVNAGSWVTTSLPANTHYTAADADFVLNIVEHSSPLPVTTGTGVTGSTYVESFVWTAPATGTGTISIWAALNAVNGDDIQNAADKWNTNHEVIGEWPGTTSSVAGIIDNISVSAFPNPVTDNLQLQMDDATAGTYSLQVFDISGRTVALETVEVAGKNYRTNINTANWASGTYYVVLAKGDSRKSISVVKR